MTTSRSRLAVLAMLLVLSVAAVPSTAVAQSADDMSAEDVVDLVESVEPSNATTMEVERVIDWASDEDNIRSLSESQYREVRDWVSNAATSHGDISIDIDSLPTIDVAEAADSVRNQTNGSNSQTLGDPARIAVSQPDYHGSTSTLTDGGRTVHVVDAQRVEIQPQNFDNGNVVGFGVAEGPGELSYDNQMDEFVFQTGGETGTFRLYWEVEERVRSDGESVETVRTRYSATIRANSSATYEHLTTDELDDRRGAAANWTAWESALHGIYGDDVDIEQKTQKAEELLRLTNNPLAALSGNFTGLLLAMFITLGGMLLLALIGVLHLAARWTDIKYINRFESLKAEERDVDKRLSDLDWREKMRSVAKWDWNDWFGDYAARAYRRISSTPYKGMKRLLSVRRPRNLVDHRAQAMLYDGYVAVVERDDVATDGGEDGADRRIVGAELLCEDVVDEDADTVKPTDDDWDAFLDALDWESDALWSYSLAESDASPEDIHVEQAPIALEDLVDALGTETRDFDSRQHWGQYLLEFVEFVRDHEFCDEDGRPDDIQMVLNEWMDTDDFLADAFDLPHFKAESEAIEWAVKHSDPVEQADARVSAATEGRDIASDD